MTTTTSISFARVGLPALVTAMALAFAGSASAASMSEGFDAGIPGSWTIVNHSAPVGTTTWFQGSPLAFNSQAGATNSYAAANFNNTTGAGDISNWLITPTMSFMNGDNVSFWTRTSTGQAYPDRLELRFSATGGTNVGVTATDVGSFTSLLLTVNPTLAGGGPPVGYPDVWTKYSATMSGLSGATNGAVAFRYFVTDGGPAGNNSDYIGVDTFAITAAVPEPTTYALMGLGLAALALRRKQKQA